MNFRLYDSAARQLTDFVPLQEGKVSIYHCGLTVQSAPHLGHIRKEVVFDVLRRWLTFSGYEVTIVANVTDIDDKILAKSAEAGVEWWAHAYHFENELHAAYRSLGCLPPTYEPRATGHIPEMVELIAELIEKGHAYPEARDHVRFGDLPNHKAEVRILAEPGYRPQHPSCGGSQALPATVQSAPRIAHAIFGVLRGRHPLRSARPNR